MSWRNLLTIMHLVGTIFGVGGSTFAEIFMRKAMNKGGVGPAEKDLLHIIYWMIRLGTLLVVLSGFGLLLFYRLTGREELLYSPKLWAKMTIMLILLFGVVAWQAKILPLWLGSAISFTSWYASLALGAWRGLNASYVSIMIGFAAALLVVAVIAQKLHPAPKPSS